MVLREIMSAQTLVEVVQILSGCESTNNSLSVLSCRHFHNKNAYLNLQFSVLFFFKYRILNHIHKIFRITSLPDSDVDRYVNTRKLLDSNLNKRRELHIGTFLP
jgi:hypothetical protein